jgi:ribosomal protein L14E/L6E/L27E
MQVGSVVYSKQGRDIGRAYVIVAQAEKEGYVWVVDGEVRTLAKPKIKNTRHLRYKGEDLEALAAKFVEGKQVFDSEIKSALRAYAK